MIHARKDYQRIQDPAGKIPADEPVFLIRAKDMNAPAIVALWAALAELNGADADIVASARKHITLIRDWQIRNGCQRPDMPK